VTLPQPLAPLHDLMLNLRWSWHGPTADLFASIDPAAWAASGGDPIAMLSGLPSARIAALATDQDFLRRLGEAERDLQQYMSEPRWYVAEGSGPEGFRDRAGPAAVALAAAGEVTSGTITGATSASSETTTGLFKA